MIYIVNTDAPGFIGALGTKLGENRHQHRDLQPRPPQGRRRSGRAGRGRRSDHAARSPRELHDAARRPRGRAAELLSAQRKGRPRLRSALRPTHLRASGPNRECLVERCCRRRRRCCGPRRPCCSPSLRTASAALSAFACIVVGSVVGIRFDRVGGVLGIRFDIVGGLFLRALVASRERAEAEGNRENGGGLHDCFPLLWSCRPRTRHVTERAIRADGSFSVPHAQRIRSAWTRRRSAPRSLRGRATSKE